MTATTSRAPDPAVDPRGYALQRDEELATTPELSGEGGCTFIQVWLVATVAAARPEDVEVHEPPPGTSRAFDQPGLYDAAAGPLDPRSLVRRPVPHEWDDPELDAVLLRADIPRHVSAVLDARRRAERARQEALDRAEAERRAAERRAEAVRPWRPLVRRPFHRPRRPDPGFARPLPSEGWLVVARRDGRLYFAHTSGDWTSELGAARVFPAAADAHAFAAVAGVPLISVVPVPAAAA